MARQLVSLVAEKSQQQEAYNINRAGRNSRCHLYMEGNQPVLSIGQIFPQFNSFIFVTRYYAI
jgi:hypothetical protein